LPFARAFVERRTQRPGPLAHRSSNFLRRQCRILRHCRKYRAVRDAVACCDLTGAWEESAITPRELRATLDRLDLRRTAFNGSEFESCHGG
jgi:hypothetical protein